MLRTCFRDLMGFTPGRPAWEDFANMWDEGVASLASSCAFHQSNARNESVHLEDVRNIRHLII